VGWGRLTCIYLSCKVEEFHVSAEELGKGIQQDPQVVLKNELTVLQASVSMCAIVSFCSASCWVLDDIMTVLPVASGNVTNSGCRFPVCHILYVCFP
jgi:hypothetical protein